tara:strand:+ start:1042 stop:1248 length:207 start_codon:yes stop_codon:yes gene_type:complete
MTDLIAGALITFAIITLYIYFIKKNKDEIPPISIDELSIELNTLGDLKEKGLLTEEEFNEQKKKLLKQ